MSEEVTGTSDKPIEIVLGTGTVIKGANPEEALRNAGKIIEDNARFGREQKKRAEELAAENERLSQEQAERERQMSEAASHYLPSAETTAMIGSAIGSY